MNKIYIIGIGYKPLDKRAKDIICKSEVILANDRLFEVFREHEDFENVKERIKIINNVHETMEFIKTQTQSSKLKAHDITLLASGDPLFFGIGRMIVNEFGKDMVEILPDLSSVQVAFSKIKEPWGGVFFMSLHGGPDPSKRRKLDYEITDIPKLLEKHNKVAILTDEQNNPIEIAKTIKSSLSNFNSQLKIFVCEKLGYADEKITEGTPEDISQLSFEHPNVVIIIQKNR